MRAAWAIARADIARRWKALMALALLTGLAGAVVLACAAGARRTDTVYERFLEASRAHHAEFSATGDLPGGMSEEAFRDRVTSLPIVQEHGSVAIIPADQVDDGRFDWGFNAAAMLDDRMTRRLDRARLITGRNPDRSEPFEAAASEALMRDEGLSVGDRVAFQPLSFEELFGFFGGREVAEFSLEPLEVTIVGVWRMPHDVSFDEQSAGLLYLTPAFARGPGAGVARLPITYVKLRGGVAAFDDFAEQVRAIAGDPDAVDVRSQAELVEKVQRAVDVQGMALLAFAALTALSAVLIAGQAIARHVQLGGRSDDVLVAVGASRGTLAAARMLGVMPLALGGALIAALGALGLSALFPLGFSRALEVSAGVRADLLVLLIGALCVVAFVIVRAGLTSVMSGRLSDAHRARRSRLADAAARAGFSPSMVAGLRFATWRGRGRNVVPLWTALSGTLIGFVALVAALTFATSFASLLRAPAEYGWTWDMLVGGGEDQEQVQATVQKLAGSEQVRSVAQMHAASLRLGGRTISIIGYRQVKGEVRFRILQGRMPSGTDEIILASRTLTRTGSRVGGTVELEQPEEVCRGAAGCTKEFNVVGRFVMPPLEESSTDEGAVVSLDAMPAIATSDGFSDLAVDLRPGSGEQVVHELLGDSGFIDRVGDPSVEIGNLARVRSLPFALAAVLGVMALATLAHLLFTSVRRRRADLATLKTLGFVRRQVRVSVAWLATAIVLAALVAGIPLGVAAGRWTWRVLNGALGLGAPSIVPIGVLIVGMLATVVVANLIAALPGRAAARTQPAIVLRAE